MLAAAPTGRKCAPARSRALRSTGRKPASAGRSAASKRRALRHHAADVVLLARHHAAEAQIARGQLPVDLVAGHMALLDAHHAERLGAVGRDAELLARRHDGADQRIAIARRDGQLVGKLAREREPITAAPRCRRDRHLARAEMRQRLVAEVELLVDQLAQHLARARARDRELRPLLGDGNKLHVERRPQHLMRRIRDAAWCAPRSRSWSS